MVESVAPCRDATSVAVLFAPDTVPIIDIFRALGDFEEQYDVEVLDRLETCLASSTTREIAKSIVSDALLLAFALRRERPEPMSYNEPGARRGTLDEYRLLALLSAASWGDLVLVAEAAGALGIVNTHAIMSLACDIGGRLETAGLRLAIPDPRLFRPEQGVGAEVAPASTPTRRTSS
jgi:hypothetical protein